MSHSAIRVGPARDLARFVATDRLVWFEEDTTASPREQVLGLPEDQMFGAETSEGGAAAYAGVYGVFPLVLPVPGPGEDTRQVPCAGLTWVGVHPDRRRQGVLTAMMRHHLEQVHETEGTFVSALHASEPAIYGRYGYGLASLGLEVTLDRGTTLSAPHLEDAAAGLATHLVAASDPGVPARMRACHRASAGLGSVVGETGYYERICRELPERRRDKEPLRVLFACRDGVDVGFVMFRRKHKWERSRPAGELEARSLVGAPAAQLALLRRLVDFDLMGTVTIDAVGTEEPLLGWVGGPRSTSDVATHDSLWVRLVDLPQALQSRTWSAPCDLVVEVADAAAPWNQGLWRVRAGADGEASVEPTSATPDLALDVAALGAAYVGGGNLVAARRAGLVAEQRPGAVAELWRAMRTDAAPSPSLMF